MTIDDKYIVYENLKNIYLMLNRIFSTSLNRKLY